MQCSLEKRFSWPGLFRIWFISRDWFLYVSLADFNIPIFILVLYYIAYKIVFAVVDSFAKPSALVLLSSSCKRVTVHPCIKLFNMFTKDRVLYLQRVLMVRTLKSLVYFQFVSTIFLSPAFGVAKIS